MNGRHFKSDEPAYKSIVDYLMGGTQKENNKTEVVGLKIDSIGNGQGKLLAVKLLRREDPHYLSNSNLMPAFIKQLYGQDFMHEFDENSFVHRLFYRMALYEMHVTGYASHWDVRRPAPRTAAARLGPDRRAARKLTKKETDKAARQQLLEGRREKGGFVPLGKGRAEPPGNPPDQQSNVDPDVAWLGLGPLQGGHGL